MKVTCCMFISGCERRIVYAKEIRVGIRVSRAMDRPRVAADG